MDARLSLLGIPAPEDFKRYAPELVALDASLRCPICSDPYQTAVSLVCGHTFCSKCIRGHFSGGASSEMRKRCPSCNNAESSEDKVRKVPALDDAVRNWSAARCVPSARLDLGLSSVNRSARGRTGRWY